VQLADRAGGEQQLDVQRAEERDHAQIAPAGRDQSSQSAHRLALQSGAADRDQRSVGDVRGQLLQWQRGGHRGYCGSPGTGAH
jgi:hypothetical protein